MKNLDKMRIIISICLLWSVGFLSAQNTAGNYIIKNLNINTEYSDFGTAFFGNDTIVFSSPRKKNSLIKNIWRPNQQKYLDLYMGAIDNSGEIINAQGMSKIVNSKFHEAQVVFTKDLKTVYFTRNNYFENTVKNDSTGNLKLQLFKASIAEDGKWINMMKLPFNSDQFSSGHPALSEDGKKLYFVSDRSESIGKTDIYVVNIKEDGTYSEPKNLGPEINTLEKEMFPFVDDNGLLYFSSEGHSSTGGLDVFVSKMYTTTYSKPLNLGTTINSLKDDFAFIINAESKRGYFSSNRENGKGDDDIYSFESTSPINIECKQLVTGTIKDDVTKEPIRDAHVNLLNDKGEVLQSATTKEDGSYSFSIDCGMLYTLKASKENFEGDSDVVSTVYDINDTPTIVNLNLKLDRKQVIASLQIEPIYYEYRKWEVSEEAKKLLDVLKKYPEIRIEAHSHTDSRGTMLFNINLSKQRAEAILKYLKDNGIDGNRVVSKWFGEKELTNKCSDNIECSEEEHQMNRRTEFLIIQ